jgi:hypothetical protein
MRIYKSISSFAAVVLLCAAGQAQIAGNGQSSFVSAAPASASLVFSASAPRLSADTALTVYERGLAQQANSLAAYTVTSLVDAELPESAQHAEFELQQHYAAPSSLDFSPLRSSGDAFVKSNVIARLLQSEVDHVHRREQSQTAISSANYKFSYKGLTKVNDVSVHVYEVKPHKKRVGLFKGKIFVDASTGYLVRAQGRIVKSPSFFVKKIDFVQDYATVDGFTLPGHLHSEAQTRIIGKTIVDIVNRDYRTEPSAGSLALQSAVIDGSN